MRFGAGHSAEHYGQPVDQALRWTPERSPGGLPTFRTTIDLGVLQPGDVLLPSVSVLNNGNLAYRCSVTADGRSWRLPEVSGRGEGTHKTPAAPPTKTLSPANAAAVTAHIDYFAIHHRLENAYLECELYAAQPPADYLFVVSVRPALLASLDTPGPRPIAPVPALSQMMQPAKQRHRTCSPTSLAMLMAHYGAPFHPSFVDRCNDPATGLYGVWPLNILQAGARGFVAGAELVPSWDALGDDYAPFVASIAFADGELSGAPLAQTPGHLVVVCGTTNDAVVCNDPAAPTAAEVRREYDLKQFSAAWLRRRGAAYFVHPTPAVTEAS